MFKAGRREGRGTNSFANGSVYEGRFRDDQIDGMGTFNMPNAVFMPKNPIESESDEEDEDDEVVSGVKKEGGSGGGETKVEQDVSTMVLEKSPNDIWIVPIHLAQDIGTIHFLAGFDKEGL